MRLDNEFLIYSEIELNLVRTGNRVKVLNKS